MSAAVLGWCHVRTSKVYRLLNDDNGREILDAICVEG
jgi:hypothetical protein